MFLRIDGRRFHEAIGAKGTCCSSRQPCTVDAIPEIGRQSKVAKTQRTMMAVVSPRGFL
jgi:predicted transcriptional regulator